MNKQGASGYSSNWPESVSQFELMRDAMLIRPRPRHGQPIPIGSALRYHRAPMAAFLVRSHGQVIL
jgi:hypothetical protein